MKALITGVTGMVGSHLADFLLENTDWDVYGVCRWRSPLDNVCHLIERVNKKDRLYFEYADLNDEMSLITVVNKIKPDYIFHLAAQSYPQTSFTAPIDTLNTNILGTCRLLEALRLAMDDDKNYKPVIHVCASSEVFGRIPAEKKPSTGIHEECPFHPASPYAISKTGTDLLGRYYAEAYGMTVMTTRMFTHTGPRRGDVFHESTFAKQIAMIEAGLIEPKVMVGNLKSLRTYADVRDAVRAYYMLVTINPVPGEYYNIGGSYTCEVGDTLRTLISYSSMKDKIEIVTDPERLRPIDADLQVPDCRKFKAHTGWEPNISFDTTMRDLLDYWRERIKMGGGIPYEVKMNNKQLLYISENPLDLVSGHGNQIRMHHFLLEKLFHGNIIECYANCNEEKNEGKSFYFKGNTIVGKIKQIIKGYPPYITRSMLKKVIQLIEKNNINFLFIENSISGKLIQLIRKRFPNIFIVSYFADIEANLMRSQISKVRLRRKLSLLTMIKNEKLTVDNADCCIVLNERDAKLFRDYYGKDPDSIIPVIVPIKESLPINEKHKANDKIKLLFVGVDYYPNVLGLDWFVQNVIPKIKVDFILEVVGYNMEKYRTRWGSQTGKVKIIGTVDSLKEYYVDADVVIAPIFDGGGMKVKTAEALSYGKKFIGTEESLLGYWESAGEFKNKFIFKCDNAEMFAETIDNLQKMDFPKCEEDVISWVNKQYSISANFDRMKALFEKSSNIHFARSIM